MLGGLHYPPTYDRVPETSQYSETAVQGLATVTATAIAYGLDAGSSALGYSCPSAQSLRSVCENQSARAATLNSGLRLWFSGAVFRVRAILHHSHLRTELVDC